MSLWRILPESAIACWRCPSASRRSNGDGTSFEADPLQRLAEKDQLMVYSHPGFWQAMDTLRDRNRLESLWAAGEAPWRVW